MTETDISVTMTEVTEAVMIDESNDRPVNKTIGVKFDTLENLQKQRINGDFCDVILQIENKDFHAHRTVLAASTDYFFKMFTIDMQEKKSKIVPIKSITARAMDEILKSIYTGKVTFSRETLSEILYAAGLMQLPTVINAAVDYIQQTITITNCFWFQSLASEQPIQSIKEAVFNFFLKNIEEISALPDYLHFTFEELDEFLSSDDLMVEEEKVVFEILKKWIYYDVETRKQNFAQLFGHVRLQFIPIDYIIDTIRKDKLVVQYSQCRTMVEDVLSYHLRPSAVHTEQKHRKCFSPDSVLFLPYQRNFQAILNLESNSWKKVSCESLTDGTVFKDCAIANRHPISVVCGGISRQGLVQKSVARFNGIRWRELPSLNEARIGAAAVCFDENIYVFGGEKHRVPARENASRSRSNYNSWNSYCGICNTFEKYDGSWELKKRLETARSYFAAHAIGNEIYLIGGYKCTADNEKKEVCNSTVTFSPTRNLWRDVGSLKTARAGFGSAVINTKIYVFGGKGDRLSNVAGIEVYDILSNVWMCVNNHSMCGGILTASYIDSGIYFVNIDQEKLWKLTINTETVAAVSCIEINRNVPGEGVLVPFSQRHLNHYL